MPLLNPWESPIGTALTAPASIFIATRPRSSSDSFRPDFARIPDYSGTVSGRTEVAPRDIFTAMTGNDGEDDDYPFKHLTTHFADVVLAMRSAASAAKTGGGGAGSRKGKKGKKKGKKKKDETDGWPLEERVAHELTKAFETEDIMIQQKLNGTWVEPVKKPKKGKGKKKKKERARKRAKAKRRAAMAPKAVTTSTLG